jgi:hypothetical protein
MNLNRSEWQAARAGLCSGSRLDLSRNVHAQSDDDEKQG